MKSACRAIIAVLPLCAVIALATQGGCFEARYLAGQGIGQWRLLRARRFVADVLVDPTVDARTKDRLKLAMEARKFGIDVLGLRGGDNFIRFLPTGGRAIAWNITAAPKDALRPLSWRFPIVGLVPYLGYFKESDAKRMAAQLRAAGYDTYVRPVAGYSTIGITSDPIYESMLDEGDARLVEVILHEMLHGTLYLAGRLSWNESLASFVGVQGAAMFFAARGGDDAGRAVIEESERRKAEEQRFSDYLAPLQEELRALYAQRISREEKLKRRELVFAHARQRFEEMYPGRRSIFSDDKHLNNAVFVSFGVYHDDSSEHEHLFKRLRGDLAAFVRFYKYAAVASDDPIGWLAQF